MCVAAQENSVGDHKRTAVLFLASSRTDRGGGKPEFTTGKKDPFAEDFEAVQTESHPL